MNITIIGIGSDIGQQLAFRFISDDNRVQGTYFRTKPDAFLISAGSPLPDSHSLGLVKCDMLDRHSMKDAAEHLEDWDVLIFAVGDLTPIGKFFSTDGYAWDNCIATNCLGPLQMLREMYPKRKPGSSVCFFSGAGVSRAAQTYSGYASSKMMLFKMTELLDDEEDDLKFFILGPGMVRTKIQRQTLEAGEAAANFARVAQFMSSGDVAHGTGTSHDRIYNCLRWCIDQPKDVVGGRNFYVPSDQWGDTLAPHLKANRDVFKMRRFGGGF